MITLASKGLKMPAQSLCSGNCKLSKSKEWKWSIFRWKTSCTMKLGLFSFGLWWSLVAVHLTTGGQVPWRSQGYAAVQRTSIRRLLRLFVGAPSFYLWTRPVVVRASPRTRSWTRLFSIGKEELCVPAWCVNRFTTLRFLRLLKVTVR